MIACIFDPHIWPHRRHGGQSIKGINRRATLCLDVLRRAIDVANAHAAPLIVAGDLIDSAGPVQPQFAAKLRDVLSHTERGGSLVLGNHDMTADGDHSLALYENSEYPPIKVRSDLYFIEHQYEYKNEACLAPFHCDIRDERVRDVPLLVAHFGVYDDSFPPWLKRSKGAWHVNALLNFMRERNIKCVLVGDWHTRCLWTEDADTGQINQIKDCGNIKETWATDARIIMQGGALVPTGWDNEGLHGYGTVALWDGERLSWQELPGPRFCVARSDAEEQSIIAEAKRLERNLFLRRYYSGERPPTPEGLEAYEALPMRVEQAVLNAAEQAGYEQPKAELERLVSKWLEQWEDDKDAMEAHIRRYL